MAHPGIKESGSLGRRTTNFAQRLENSLATPKAEYDKGQAYVHQVDAELTLLRKTMLPHQRGDPDTSGNLVTPTSTTSAIPLEDATTVAGAESLPLAENDQLAAIQ